MSEFRSNKSFQFICGCGTIALLYFLWVNNVFAFLLNDSPPEGMESASITALVLTSIVSAVQLIGIVSIFVVAGVLKPLAEWTVDAVRKRFPKVDAAASNLEETVDIDKLLKVLNELDDRLKKIEGDQP